MIRVGITRPRHFYGPEVFALVRHFADDPEVRYVLVDDPADLEDPSLDLAHVMMGFQPRWRRHRTPQLHDYASLSTPPRARLKDAVKRFGQVSPLLRSFLSPYVRDRLGFTDGRPHVLRDMGVPDSFYPSSPAPPVAHDIGYAGSLTSARGLTGPLRSLAAAGFRLLLIGDPDPELREALAAYPQVTFAGRLSQEDVPAALRTCSHGLNYVPDVAPFNAQTSTKVLEYSALGLRVLTNDYRWVRRFQVQHDAVFAVLDPARPLTPDGLATLPLRGADPEPFRWSTVLDGSRLRERIEEVVRAR